MLHHFHDDFHAPGQGSISASDFEVMLDYLDSEYDLINPYEFAARIKKGSLTGKETCLSFDDALRCQIDVALPVLKKRNLFAYFFVYSSAFTDMPDDLEFFRDFRHIKFASLEEFYQKFFELFQVQDAEEFQFYKGTYPTDYLSGFPFYTDMDRRFRYVRDMVLGPEKYKTLMYDMMTTHEYDKHVAKERLFMSEQHLKDLVGMGNVVGLHSHSHPMRMGALNYEEQEREFIQNYNFLRDVTGQKIWAMSHPCGSYNDDTISILKSLNVEIGFRSNMEVQDIKSPYEVPREDHANIIKKLS